jgi:hypothetical protein
MHPKRRHWIHVSWLLLATAFCSTAFWAFWALREVEWPLPRFTAALGVPALIYVLASLVAPSDPASVHSWRDYFFQVRVPSSLPPFSWSEPSWSAIKASLTSRPRTRRSLPCTCSRRFLPLGSSHETRESTRPWLLCRQRPLPPSSSLWRSPCGAPDNSVGPLGGVGGCSNCCYDTRSRVPSPWSLRASCRPPAVAIVASRYSPTAYNGSSWER